MEDKRPVPEARYEASANGVNLQQAGATLITPDPVQMQCPNCGQQIVTVVSYESGSLTYLLIAGLLLCGCWLGCCLIPTCVDGCKDAVHSCPNCNHIIGTKHRL